MHTFNEGRKCKALGMAELGKAQTSVDLISIVPTYVLLDLILHALVLVRYIEEDVHRYKHIYCRSWLHPRCQGQKKYIINVA